MTRDGKEANVFDLWKYFEHGNLPMFKAALEKALAIDSAGGKEAEEKIVNAKRGGKTLAHRACELGKSAYLEALVNAGADLALRDDNTGDTPLIALAGRKYSPESLQCLCHLIEPGDETLRINTANKAGLTARDVAEKNESLAGSAFLEKLLSQKPKTGSAFKRLHYGFSAMLFVCFFCLCFYGAREFPYMELDGRNMVGLLQAISMIAMAYLFVLSLALYVLRNYGKALEKAEKSLEGRLIKLCWVLGLPVLLFYARVDALEMMNKAIPVDPGLLPLSSGYMTAATLLMRFCAFYVPLGAAFVCASRLLGRLAIFKDPEAKEKMSDRGGIGLALMDLAFVLILFCVAVLGPGFDKQKTKVEILGEFEPARIENGKDLGDQIRRLAMASDFSKFNLCDNPEIELNDRSEKAVGVLFVPGAQGKVLGLAKASSGKLAFKMIECMAAKAPASNPAASNPVVSNSLAANAPSQASLVQTQQRKASQVRAAAHRKAFKPKRSAGCKSAGAALRGGEGL